MHDRFAAIEPDGPIPTRASVTRPEPAAIRLLRHARPQPLFERLPFSSSRHARPYGVGGGGTSWKVAVTLTSPGCPGSTTSVSVASNTEPSGVVIFTWPSVDPAPTMVTLAMSSCAPPAGTTTASMVATVGSFEVISTFDFSGMTAPFVEPCPSMTSCTCAMSAMGRPSATPPRAGSSRFRRLILAVVPEPRTQRRSRERPPEDAPDLLHVGHVSPPLGRPEEPPAPRRPALPPPMLPHRH